MNKSLTILLLCLILGCNNSPLNTAQNSTPVVYTTFYPTYYFAQRIAGNLIQLECPTPEDEDPIFWEAYKQPEIVQQYQQADLIILNGAKFTKWVENVSLPQDKIVNTAKPFEKDFIIIKDATVHRHGDGKEHSHAGLDGHTWIDPINAKIQAKEIKKALGKLLPKHISILDANFTKLENDLEALNKTLIEYQKNEKSNQPLLASHPAYNYIARRFDWNIKNLDLDPEVMPSEETFTKIRKILQSHSAKFILWETYPKQEIAQRFKDELSLESIEFSPCELLSSEEKQQGLDYLAIMKKNLENLRKIWK